MEALPAKLAPGLSISAASHLPLCIHTLLSSPLTLDTRALLNPAPHHQHRQALPAAPNAASQGLRRPQHALTASPAAANTPLPPHVLLYQLLGLAIFLPRLTDIPALETDSLHPPKPPPGPQPPATPAGADVLSPLLSPVDGVAPQAQREEAGPAQTDGELLQRHVVASLLAGLFGSPGGAEAGAGAAGEGAWAALQWVVAVPLHALVERVAESAGGRCTQHEQDAVMALAVLRALLRDERVLTPKGLGW